MSFQAYLDTIKNKTGKGPADFRKIAEKKGLLGPQVKAGQVLAWLKSDFDLGHGHALAMYAWLQSTVEPKRSDSERVDKHFAGARSVWKKSYERLLARAKKFGSDVSVDPTDTYISLLRGGKKFAIVQPRTDRLYVGIKLKGLDATGRLSPSGTWNAMVTHRVAIENDKEMDSELIGWLRSAYDKA